MPLQMPSPLTVSVIGGTGSMGKLISFLLTKYGFTVHLLGRKSPDFNKCIRKSDIILFSVPIKEFKDSLKLVEKINLKKKVLVDMSSGILNHLKLMRRLSPSAGFIHLMFGPDIYNIKNQNVIVSDKMNDDRFAKLVGVFKSEGASVIQASSERHDYMMAIVQALSQFSTISLAKTISETSTNKKELDGFSSVTFSLNMEVISRIIGQKPELWASIQFNNVVFEKMVKEHIKNVKLFAKYVEEKDYESFCEEFNKMAPFWKEENQIEYTKKEIERKNNIPVSDIGTLGPEGSYSQEAVLKYKADSKPLFFDSIGEVIKALDTGKIKTAILPFENSIQGTVLESMDSLYHHNFKINGEINVPIKHVLAGLDKKIPHKDIKYIYSHPQALGQCSTFLAKNYPHAKLILTPSTSAALKKIKDEGLTNTLAIGSKLAAKIYNLSVIAENIQDVKNNVTLFVVTSKKSVKKDLDFLFIVINPKTDRPGLLYDILSVFKKKSINLLKIESRPSKGKIGSYIFYLKAEISNNDKRRDILIKELQKFGSVKSLT